MNNEEIMKEKWGMQGDNHIDPVLLNTLTSCFEVRINQGGFVQQNFSSTAASF